MFKNSSKSFKNIMFGCSVVFVLLCLFIGLVNYFSQNGKNHKKIVDKAVAEIRLPAKYVLVSSNYDDQGCLDVCAHTLLSYKAQNSESINCSEVGNELNLIGYQKTSYGYQSKDASRYRKQLDGKNIEVVCAANSDGSKLTIDVTHY